VYILVKMAKKKGASLVCLEESIFDCNNKLDRLANHVSEIDKHILRIDKQLVTMRTDVRWLKRLFFALVASALLLLAHLL